MTLLPRLHSRASLLVVEELGDRVSMDTRGGIKSSADSPALPPPTPFAIYYLDVVSGS